jgi:hypothetical protein
MTMDNVQNCDIYSNILIVTNIKIITIDIYSKIVCNFEPGTPICSSQAVSAT